MAIDDSACPIDRAQHEVEAAIEDALRQNARQGQGYLVAARADGACVDCEEPVEAGRLKLGLGRCLACATQYEAQRRIHAGAR